MAWHFPWNWDVYDWFGLSVVLGWLTVVWIIERTKL